MGIYIHGMKMPPRGKVNLLVMFDDGTVQDNSDGQNQWQAIELLPHGRLGDLDALMTFVDAGHLRNPLELSWSDADVASMIDSRPTIIPADGGDT